MVNHKYFKSTMRGKIESNVFFEQTKDIFSSLSDALSHIDTLTLSEYARVAKQYSLKAQDVGDTDMFNFFGSLADYAAVLEAGIIELDLLGESSEEYDDDTVFTEWDPEKMHPIIISYFNNILARLVSAEKGITAEEAKVWTSLTGEYKLCLDFYY